MRPTFAFALLACALPAAADTCSARSGELAPTVIELYTSEGCSSCPPADRWLSSVHRRDGVVALAFHGDYWDRLGWRDRFASRAYTERQYRRQHTSGARFVYTPQVLVDGSDWRRWPSLPAPRPARLDIELRRDGSRVEASVAARAGAPARLAGYWAVVEDGHSSDVRAGENAGATLRHDAVVRRYEELAAWPSSETRRLRLDTTPPRAPGALVLVVTEAAGGRPLGALRLDC